MKKMKISTVMILFTLITIVVSTAIITIFSITATQSISIEMLKISAVKKLNGDVKSAYTYVKQYFGELSYLEDKYSFVDSRGVLIDRRYALVDEILEDLGDTATIFARKDDDFIRVITNIKKNDGSRAVGTLLGTASAAYDSVMRGELYVGNAVILGKEYITAYDPIISSAGDVVGILYVGVPDIKNSEQVQSRLRAELIKITVIAIVIILCGISLSYYIVQQIIVKRIKLLEKAVSNLEKGKLDERLEEGRQDEIGVLISMLNTSLDRLEEMVSLIKYNADSMLSSTHEISKGNESLAQRTTEQASAIEEVAATVEENNSTITNNADNAHKANTVAQDTIALAESGGKLMQDSLDAIGEISNSSKRIEEIITVIDEIAFQTNLLALNAAVEAARAGDHGRGFAVVASEVQNLAQRSRNASKDIGELIRESLVKVDNGNQLTQKAGDSIKSIIEAINSVAGFVAEISVASDEQRRGSDQINTALVEIDNMTQQNASLVEETSAASEAMVGMAENLYDSTERFSVRLNLYDKQN